MITTCQSASAHSLKCACNQSVAMDHPEPDRNVTCISYIPPDWPETDLKLLLLLNTQIVTKINVAINFKVHVNTYLVLFFALWMVASLRKARMLLIKVTRINISWLLTWEVGEWIMMTMEPCLLFAVESLISFQLSPLIASQGCWW